MSDEGSALSRRYKLGRREFNPYASKPGGDDGRRKRRRPYFTIAKDRLLEVAVDRELVGGAWRVFLYYASEVTPSHSITRVDAPATGRALEMPTSNVYSHIALLVKKRLLWRPRPGWLGLHPSFAWVGSEGDRRRAQEHTDSIDRWEATEGPNE